MENHKLPRLLLAAPGSGSGKTLIACGLLEALKEEGIRLSSFKCGPDYIDPMFHRTVLGLPSRNLDSFFTDKPTLRFLLRQGAEGTELSVIEGVMGYYDGLGGVSRRGSTSEIAEWTETPVVLIVNCRGMSLSAAALIKGFLEYQRTPLIRGVILNQVSPMMYGPMKKAIEEELPVKVYGYVPRLSDGLLESRHLGLKRPEEAADLSERLKRLAAVLKETVELSGLMALAAEAPPIREQEPALERGGPVKVAVASDEAFDFYYEDNLGLLRRLGAELCFFSPLKDHALPEGACGLILGGGYPELYAEALSENRKMREAVKKAVEEGLPCLAECGGFLYLHETLEDDTGRPWPMAGVIEGRAYKTDSLRRFGYVTLTAKEESLLGPAGEQFPAHEFHYWDSTENGAAFTAKKPSGSRSWDCMVNRGRLLAGFPHLYYYGNPRGAERFLAACRGFGKEKEQNG